MTRSHGLAAFVAAVLVSAAMVLSVVPALGQSPTPSVPAAGSAAPCPSPLASQPAAASAAAQPSATPAAQPSATPCAAATAASVTIKDLSFQPDSISVTVGSTVTWTNDDSTGHTVTADDGSFDSGTLDPGATFSQTFSTAGTFAYHCTIHPSMKGTITVG